MFSRGSIDILLFSFRQSRFTINHTHDIFRIVQGLRVCMFPQQGRRPPGSPRARRAGGWRPSCGVRMAQGRISQTRWSPQQGEQDFGVNRLKSLLHKSHIRMNKDAMIANLKFIFIEINYILRDWIQIPEIRAITLASSGSRKFSLNLLFTLKVHFVETDKPTFIRIIKFNLAFIIFLISLSVSSIQAS